ncbi:unnamed protein product [Camellia sinensis]
MGRGFYSKPIKCSDVKRLKDKSSMMMMFMFL